jgi:hypothetical protein
MFSTITLARPRRGREGDLIATFERWWRDRKPERVGVLAAHIVKNSFIEGEYVATLIFESRERYEEANADPDQQRWTREFYRLLEEEPRTIYGDMISHHQADAGVWVKDEPAPS